MMTKQERKENIERQQYVRDGRKKDLRQRMIVGADASVGKRQGQKTVKSESLQKEGNALKWQRIISRWCDLTLGIKFLEKYRKDITEATMPNKHIYLKFKWIITSSFKRKNLLLKMAQTKDFSISKSYLQDGDINELKKDLCNFINPISHETHLKYIKRILHIKCIDPTP